jgi:hypothetical protein
MSPVSGRRPLLCIEEEAAKGAVELLAKCPVLQVKVDDASSKSRILEKIIPSRTATAPITTFPLLIWR